MVWKNIDPSRKWLWSFSNLDSKLSLRASIVFMVTYGMLLGFVDRLFVVDEKFLSSKLSFRDNLNAWSLIIVVVLVFMFLGLFLLNTQFILLEENFVLLFCPLFLFGFTSFSAFFLKSLFLLLCFISVVVQLKRSYV